MNRVSTTQLQGTLMTGMQRSQSGLALSQFQLSTGKKAPYYSQLGADGVRALSANSLLSRQESYSDATKQTSSTLALYDTHMASIESTMTDLRKQLMNALGLDNGNDIAANTSTAFDDFKATINAQVGGNSLFAGSQTGTKPLAANDLSDTIGLDPADAFVNDTVRGTARVGEGLDLQYGVVASDFGGDFVKAFGTLANMGPIDGKLTDTQKDALRDAVSQIDTGLDRLNAVNGENGRKLAYLDTLTDRADGRAQLMQKVVGDTEDADLGQVVTDLTMYQTTLQASYSVFSRLSSMTLANYLT
ncbi:MAG TPA: flagellin [Sphingobium sp.]|uniref:flagellin N-terminal helical domain-containing protein n=1 Tax=Sphingobium sp. TaxID=1912891 RepID=UPI002ED37577